MVGGLCCCMRLVEVGRQLTRTKKVSCRGKDLVGARVRVYLEKVWRCFLKVYIMKKSRIKGAAIPDVVVHAKVSERSRYSELRS